MVDKLGARSSTYEEFIGSLPSDKSRFAIYDYEAKRAGGQTVNKIVLFIWTPDGSRPKVWNLFPIPILDEILSKC